jgi:hypothetical protein
MQLVLRVLIFILVVRGDVLNIKSPEPLNVHTPIYRVSADYYDIFITTKNTIELLEYFFARL